MRELRRSIRRSSGQGQPEPGGERAGDPADGQNLCHERLAELSKLAEAIALGDGFAFYVLIAPSPEAAAEALSALQKDQQGAGEASVVESIRPLWLPRLPKPRWKPRSWRC